MPKTRDNLRMSLTGMSFPQWRSRMELLTDEDGYCHPLGSDHAAIFLESGPRLLVSFEQFDALSTFSERAHPMGFNYIRNLGWSNMCLLAKDRSWFRSPEIFAHFDRLADEGFFDEFEQVLFYGAGPAGYAAAVYSVTAPGARALLISPQATLDPHLTPWETRFRSARRQSFVGRYDYGPRMIEATSFTHVIFDPRQALDAMHASLYAQAGAHLLPLPHASEDVQADLHHTRLLPRMISKALHGTLSTYEFAHLRRKRHSDKTYLKRLMQAQEPRHKQQVLVLQHRLRGQTRRRDQRKLQQVRQHNQPQLRLVSNS